MRIAALLVVLSACGLGLAAENKKDDKRTDLDRLQGTWVVSDTKGFSKDTPPDELKNLKLVIKDKRMTAHYGDKTAEATFSLDSIKTPGEIDVKVTDGPADVKGRTFPCIYLLEGPVFKVAFRNPGEKRPEEFASRDRKDVHEVWFKKAKK